MHVSPAKYSYAWLPRKCDYRTDTRTNRQTDRRRTKWSLCVAMLNRRHKNENKNQVVLVKHYAPGGKKVQKAIFSTKVTRSLTLVSFERASIVEHACQIWSLCLFTYGSKAIANVKVDNRQKDRQTNKQTGQQYAPDHSIWGIKKILHTVGFRHSVNR